LAVTTGLNIPLIGNSSIKITLFLLVISYLGYTVFLYSIKFNTNKPGVVVNSDGVIDNSSFLSQGLILWENIEDVKGIKKSNDWLMLLVLKRPEEFIKRTKNPQL
jgi:hypothetical protein